MRLRVFLQALEAAGVDCWDISCWRESRRGYFGTETLLSDWVRQFSSKPRIVAGNIMTPQEATDYTNEGHAEAVALARALIVDAQWANKARRGELPRPVLDDSWRVINQGTDPGA